MTESRNATQLLSLILDPRSFESWDRPIDISHHPADYRRALVAAATRAGADEAVLTGSGLLRGRRVAVIVSEFQFLGGSVGVATADRITAAVRRATAERLPIVASTASGGTRMQEGSLAFVRMIDISRALMSHRQAGLPYLVHLRSPSMGGVYASWGSLGHLTVAEPAALIGFLGPKVYNALHGSPFPAGVQTAENLHAHRVIDAVVPDHELPQLVDRALRVLVDAASAPRFARSAAELDPDLDAWAAIRATRDSRRIGVRDLLRHGSSETVRLRGAQATEADDSMILALTRLDGLPCVLVGQDRAGQGEGERAMGPSALRAAGRAMTLAEELGLPLVTVIDTPGARLSVSAEEGALSGEIARCLTTMSELTVPSVALLLGQGCGGGALALLPARVVVAAEKAWLSPLSPEGASVIVHRDPARAAEVARRQGVRAIDLLAAGTVDVVVAERPARTGPELARALIAEVRFAVQRQLAHSPDLGTLRRVHAHSFPST